MSLRESIKNQTAFSLQLTNHLIQKSAKQSNFVFSPLSIHVILSLIAAGSEGETLDQILSFLNSQTSGDLNSLSSLLVATLLADASHCGGPKVSFANGVWIQKDFPLKPRFNDVVDNVYKGFANHVDFKANADEVISEVNSWAEKQTSGLIKEILPSGSVDSLTRLVLANALYFKGAWDQKFDMALTKEYDFHLLDKTSVRTSFMTTREDQRLGEYDGFKILGLPYRQGEDKRRFSMYIILPDEVDGLPALAEKVASEPGFLDNHLPVRDFAVGEFRIPKFKISFGFEASEVLKEMGLVAPFCGGLTEMVDSPEGKDVFVSNIFHKSFVEVNEEGTEAAAVSAATIMLMCMPITIDFVADHPFMFMIREDTTGVVVFAGHVLNPILTS